MAGDELRLGGAERLVESVIDRHTCVHRAALAFGYGCVNLRLGHLRMISDPLARAPCGMDLTPYVFKSIITPCELDRSFPR